jgi:DNA polymerase III psi subunit
MESWPLEQLRRDPAAKRALWPQLRALRKGGTA